MCSNTLLLLVIINKDSLAVCKKFNTQRNIFNEKISNILENASYKNAKAKKKYMCVYCHMSTKSRVGRSALIFFFFFLTIGKTGNSRSRTRNLIPVFHFRNFR